MLGCIRQIARVEVFRIECVHATVVLRRARGGRQRCDVVGNIQVGTHSSGCRSEVPDHRAMRCINKTLRLEPQADQYATCMPDETLAEIGSMRRLGWAERNRLDNWHSSRERRIIHGTPRSEPAADDVYRMTGVAQCARLLHKPWIRRKMT
jgi:hypothetical protein